VRRSADPPPDPFGEHPRALRRARFTLLGARFEFTTESAALERIVRRAYAGLPSQALPGAPRLSVRLTVTPAASGSATTPAAICPFAAPGILGGASAGAGVTAVVPGSRSALVAVPRKLLRRAYHVRYELVEFASYLLAARTQKLLPLHAACVGRGARGVLVCGASGAGKSTLALHCLVSGLDFLAEDSVLLEAGGLLATGVANFLHLRRDALRFLPDRTLARRLAAAALIQRRSGVRKLEIDLRRPGWRLAARPLRICAVIFLSAQRAAGSRLLVRLSRGQLLRRLEASQRYAAQQPPWEAARERLGRLPAFELRRGRHPQQAVAALESLLGPQSPQRR